MPSALEPQGAGMAAMCPTGYGDDTQAITLAPAAAPMAGAQAVTDNCLAHMLDNCFPLGPLETCHLLLCIGSFTFMS